MTDLFKAIGAIAGAIVAIITLLTATGVLNGAPSTADAGGDGVVVANVYNLPRDRGLDYLDDQGFTNVSVIEVCSNSVGAGNIREVLLDDGASVADETVFVGPLGSKPINVPLSTKLLVKVSTGNGCS